MNLTVDDHADDMAVDTLSPPGQVNPAAEPMMDVEGFIGKYITDSDYAKTLRSSHALLKADLRLGESSREMFITEMQRIARAIIKRDPPLGPILENPSWLRAIGDFGPDRAFRLWETEAEKITSDDIDMAMTITTATIEDVLIAAVSIHNKPDYSMESRDQEAVHQDFIREYKGDAVDRLQGALRNHNKSYNGVAGLFIYTPVLVLLQSSGSGKTRAAVQLCSRELGLVACVRSRIKGQVTSAPPPDETVYHSLVENMRPGETEETATLFVGAWLVAYLAEFAQLCERAILDVTGGKGVRSKEDWSAFIEHIASLLTDGIVQDFVTVPARPAVGASGSSPSSKAGGKKGKQLQKTFSSRDEFLAAVSVRADIEVTVYSSHLESVKAAPNAKAMAEHFAGKMATSLEILKTLRNGQEGVAFLALDEAMSLGTTRLSVLRRIASHFGKPDFWVIFLDTNNKVSEWTGEQAHIPSARLSDSSEQGLKLPEPFVTLPHDIFLRADPTWLGCLSGQSQFQITHAESLDMIPKMGRPLWNDASWRIGSHNGRCVNGISLELILAKLIGGHSEKFLSSPDGLGTRSLALASQRVPLNLIAMQGVSAEENYLEVQISHHLRTVIGVETDGQRIASFAPSEPLLSLAAADVFRRNPEVMWSNVVREVHRLARVNALLLGEGGEEHVRIAANAAVDFAIRKRHDSGPKPSEDSTNWFIISVYDWLSAFLGPDCANRTDIQDWARRHWIDFTHYVKGNRRFTASKPMSRSYFAQAWLRQAALLGSITQPVWDIMIVALESEQQPKLTDTLDIAKLRPIAIQIKNRADHAPSKLVRLANLTKSTFFPADLKHGSLSLYISLAASTASAEVKKDTTGDHRSIYIGCEGEKPLHVFAGPSTSNHEAPITTMSSGFSAAREAQSLLDRWRNCYHSLDGGDDGSMADFLAGAMYEEDTKIEIQIAKAGGSDVDELQAEGEDAAHGLRQSLEGVQGMQVDSFLQAQTSGEHSSQRISARDERAKN